MQNQKLAQAAATTNSATRFPTFINNHTAMPTMTQQAKSEQALKKKLDMYFVELEGKTCIVNVCSLLKT